MNIKSLFGLVIILVCQFFVTNAMLINRMTPKPDQGFQVQLNLTKNEPFWLCFGYIPANHTHHHSFRWDKCTNERQQTLNAHHGFSYTIHAEWDAGLLNLKFWRAEITDQDYMIVNNAHIPDSQLIITHTRGITSINDNTIKYSAIVRAIEAPVPLSGGSPIVHREPPPHKLDTLHVLNKTVEVNGLQDRGIMVIGDGRGISSMQLLDA